MCVCLFKHVFMYSTVFVAIMDSVPLPPLPPTFQATQMEEAYGHYCKHYKANKDLIGGSRAESEFYRVSWAHCPFVLCGGRGGEGRGGEGRGRGGKGWEGERRGGDGRGGKGGGEGREGKGRGGEGREGEGRALCTCMPPLNKSQGIHILATVQHTVEYV